MLPRQAIPLPGTKSLRLTTAPSSGGESLGVDRQVRSPYIEQLPTFDRPIFGGFTLIEVPDGVNCSASAAWYGLIDIDVEKAFGQDVMLFSADVDQSSCDVAGDGGATYLAWGDANGGAAIVIGTNLPIGNRPDEWVTAPVNLPGLRATGQPVTVTSDRAQYILHRYFPSGDYQATTPIRRTITKSWAPYGYRLPVGSRLQAALVLMGSQVVNASGGPLYIRGAAGVQLWVGLTENRSSFGRV